MSQDRECPHCGRGISVDVHEQKIAEDRTQKKLFSVHSLKCPSCSRWAIFLVEQTIEVMPEALGNIVIKKETNEICINPMGGHSAAPPKETPADMAIDFNEAARVLPHSAKASAALSRRCLQQILHARGYTKRNLVDQIDDLLNETDPSKVVPPSLRDAIDAIRNYGNFSAHPITDKTTLQIIEVEPGEADWCLEILRECLEVFYVHPKRIADRKAALDKKLTEAGKPPSK